MKKAIIIFSFFILAFGAVLIERFVFAAVEYMVRVLAEEYEVAE